MAKETTYVATALEDDPLASGVETFLTIGDAFRAAKALGEGSVVFKVVRSAIPMHFNGEK